jgi:hypothetical protein
MKLVGKRLGNMAVDGLQLPEYQPVTTTIR